MDEPGGAGSDLTTMADDPSGALRASTNGTAPAHEPVLVVEKARAADAADIHAVVTFFADRDEMLHRPLNEVYENLRDFYVARVDGEFAGCVALHLWWADLAEIKSLAVREDRQL